MSRLNEGAPVAPHPVKALNVGISFYSDTSFGEVEKRLAHMLFPTHKVDLRCNRAMRNVAEDMHVFYRFLHLFMYKMCTHEQGTQKQIVDKRGGKRCGWRQMSVAVGR